MGAAEPLSVAVHEPFQFGMFPVRRISIGPLFKLTRTISNVLKKCTRL